MDYSLLRGKIASSKYRNISQLADAIGTKRQSLSYKINGKRPFSVDEVERIRLALNLSNDETIACFFEEKCD